VQPQASSEQQAARNPLQGGCVGTVDADSTIERVVLLGGAGFIGGALVPRLRARLPHVRIEVVDSLSRGSVSNLDGITPIIDMDVADTAALTDVVRDASVVVCLASWVGGVADVHSDAASVLRTAQLGMSMAVACADAGVARVVYVGTACSYNADAQRSPDAPGEAARVMDECRDLFPSDPETSYGWAKLFSEVAAASVLQPATLRVVRLHNVYGPGMPLRQRQVVADLTLRALQDLGGCRNDAGGASVAQLTLKVRGDGANYRDFLYVDDAAEAVLLGIVSRTWPSAPSQCDRVSQRVVSASVAFGTGVATTVQQLALEVGRAALRHARDRVPRQPVSHVDDVHRGSGGAAHAGVLRHASVRGECDAWVGADAPLCSVTDACSGASSPTLATASSRDTACHNTLACATPTGDTASSSGVATPPGSGLSARDPHAPSQSADARVQVVCDASAFAGDFGRVCDASAAHALGWRHTVSVADGVSRTVAAIAARVDFMAVSVPMTSRGLDMDGVDARLRGLAQSLPGAACTARVPVRVYIAVDAGDDLLAPLPTAWFAQRLGVPCTKVVLPRMDDVSGWHKLTCGDVTAAMLRARPFAFPVFAVHNCLTRVALRDGAAWFALLGDDVRVSTPLWADAVKDTFDRLARETGLPGVGVVALRDVTAPGFPTFPVVGRWHVTVFDGLCPSVFVNQDADPFVWELYRRFNAARFAPGHVLLENGTGGVASEPRYVRSVVCVRATAACLRVD
jgi:nucleoside-diphosphate-sugar epimerase